MSLGIKALCQQAYIWLLKVDPLNPKTAILSNCSSSDGVRKEKWSRPWKHDLEEEQALKDVYIKYISIDQKFVSETIMGCWEFAKNCFLENVDCRIRQSDTNWKITECSSLCRPDQVGCWGLGSHNSVRIHQYHFGSWLNTPSSIMWLQWWQRSHTLSNQCWLLEFFLCFCFFVIYLSNHRDFAEFCLHSLY